MNYMNYLKGFWKGVCDLADKSRKTAHAQKEPQKWTLQSNIIEQFSSV